MTIDVRPEPTCPKLMMAAAARAPYLWMVSRTKNCQRAKKIEVATICCKADGVLRINSKLSASSPADVAALKRSAKKLVHSIMGQMLRR